MQTYRCSAWRMINSSLGCMCIIHSCPVRKIIRQTARNKCFKKYLHPVLNFTWSCAEITVSAIIGIVVECSLTICNCIINYYPVCTAIWQSALDEGGEGCLHLASSLSPSLAWPDIIVLAVVGAVGDSSQAPYTMTTHVSAVKHTNSTDRRVMEQAQEILSGPVLLASCKGRSGTPPCR